MRRVRYSVAMSLDGYIAGPNGEADWILMDPEIDFASIWKQFDTLLMGRRTYAAMSGPKDGQSGGTFSGLEIVVVSRTLEPRHHPDVTVISEPVNEAVAALKAQPGKDIWLFGGGNLFRSLLELGLVDTIEVAVIPILLGDGIPLLPRSAGRASLTLTSHRVLPQTGTLLLAYDVKRRGKRRRTR